MSSFTGLAVVQRTSGKQPDPVSEALEAVAFRGGRLAVALLTQHDAGKLADALAEAQEALALAEVRSAAVLDALSPATDDEVQGELARLVRSWPQDKRSDLAGYAAELAVFVLERQPSRRGLEQACRGLKLRRVHLPSIAEVMDALAGAEGAIAAATQQLATLPERISRAEAALGISAPGPVSSRAGRAA